MDKNKSTTEPSTYDPSFDRKIVAREMTKLFNLGSLSKRDHPTRWSKERRTAYNERVRTIQELFDIGSYPQAKYWMEWLDEENKLTGKKYEKNYDSDTHKKEQT